MARGQSPYNSRTGCLNYKWLNFEPWLVKPTSFLHHWGMREKGWKVISLSLEFCVYLVLFPTYEYIPPSTNSNNKMKYSILRSFSKLELQFHSHSNTCLSSPVYSGVIIATLYATLANHEGSSSRCIVTVGKMSSEATLAVTDDIVGMADREDLWWSDGADSLATIWVPEYDNYMKELTWY